MTNDDQFGEALTPEMVEQLRSKIAVRPDLTEAAFRKYEPFIAKACFGSLIIDPNTLTQRDGFRKCINATSFKCRLQDAMLAYKRFGYASGLIPPDYNLECIKVRIVADDKVLLENLYPYGQQKTISGIAANRLTAENKDAVLAVAREIESVRKQGKSPTPVYISYSTLEGYKWVKSLESDTGDFPNMLVSDVKDRPNMVMLW